MCFQRGKSFKNATSLATDVYPSHNEVVGSDNLFTISLNYRWRMLIAALLDKAWSNDLSELSLDNQDFLSALILDLYDSETTPSMSILTTVLAVLAGTTSTTSTTFVQVATSAIAFTPTKANFRVTCHGISAFNSANNRTFFEVRFNDIAGVQSAQASVANTTPREISVSAVFEGVDIGAEYDLKLFFRVNAGTGTIATNSSLVYEIIEYD